MKQIRVLLADDHTLFREGLAGIIDAQADFTVVGEAVDGLEAVVKARALVPDLILMDLSMPGTDGLEATRLIKEELPKTIVVMVTVHDQDEQLFEAIRCGAQGYLLKSIGSQEMLELLRGAVKGEPAVSPSLAGRMLEEFRRLSQGAPAQAAWDTVTLTHREQEVLALAAQGASDKEIASELVVSSNTVKSHMRSILTKLHVSSRHEAARLARRLGLV